MFAKAVAVSLLTLASAQVFAADDKCSVTVDSTDQMTFSTKEIAIDKSCKQFTINLEHSGNLPKNVMGHNLVIAKDADMAGVVADGGKAGVDKNYVAEGDARVVAHTKVIGAKEKDSVTFDLSKLAAGEKYSFFCTFPGHYVMMKGAVVLK